MKERRIIINKITVTQRHDGRMSMHDAAKYIGFTYPYLKDSYRKSGMPRSVKVGRLIYFFQKDLDKWINSNPING